MWRSNYVNELTNVCMEMFKSTGTMFEQEHLRFISMFVAAGSTGASGGSYKYPKGIVEHEVIQNLRGVSGDKPL